MADTDRLLLEAAARAAGIDLAWSSIDGQSPRDQSNWNTWDPLTDDGDAFRLAVKLRLSFEHSYEDTCVIVRQMFGAEAIESHRSDPLAASRRAIVRAAAEIGGFNG